MEVLIYIFVGILIIVCSCLIFLVVIQNSKGGGLSTSINITNTAAQIIGVRKAADLVEKATWWFIGIIAGLTFVINFSIFANSGGDTGGLIMKEAIQKQGGAPTQAPGNNTQPQGSPQQTPTNP
ncbi:MAG: preprotein translocase subunit SecG [Bacteroidia bacterium]|nr:preprotein translocase subunit SecG [Bacteroidia bacterium]MDW8158258.1 preprotein translocase subunit SecG [Bacteroidia bacterium]